MTLANDRTTEFATNVADLRLVPLAEMHARDDGAVNDALARILPQNPSPQVPVAAFNSSI